MKTSIKLLGLLAVLSPPLSAQNATIRHYWDFETDFTDKVGTADGTAGAEVSTTTGHDANTAAFFPTEITSGDPFDDTGYVGISPVIANVGGGAIAFSFSYWVRLDFDDTTNARGIFDFSSDAPIATMGADGPQSLYIQNGGNDGNLAFRVDGTTGNAVGFVPVSAFEGTVGTPTGTWFFIAATFDPSSDLNIYLNGNPTPAATVDATTVGTVNWETLQYLGAFNVSVNVNRGLEGGVDDVAIYRDVLTTTEIAGLFAGTLAPTDIDAPLPGPTPIGHYWDMDTVDGGTFIPLDLGNGLATNEVGLTDLSTDPDYGEAYAGSGFSLNTALADTNYLVADTHDGSATGLDFGTSSFSISYMGYDHSDPTLGDNDVRSIMAMDCLSGTDTGFQISSNTSGHFIFRLDDDAGNDVVSTAQVGTAYETLAMPANQWVCVVINVDRNADEVEVFFDGVSQGTYDISSLSGNIVCSQDFQMGVINGGASAAQAQKSGLDDIAIYPGVLTSQQVTDLCAQSVTPLDLLATFVPPAPIQIVSVDYDSGTDEVTVIFTTENGSTYSVYGDTTLTTHATWSELTGADITGDGTNKAFTYAPPGAPGEFYLEVRED